MFSLTPLSADCTSSDAVLRWLEDPEVGLMLRARAGDGDAFAELVRAYSRLVVFYFYRRLGSYAEAEDLAQELFLRLYRARGRYEPKSRFVTWLLCVARNISRNAVRDRQRHKVVRLGTSSDTGEVNGVTDPRDSPTWRLERSELRGVVRTAVAKLNRRQRAAIELYQFHGHTLAEVATALDVTPEAVKSLLSRARSNLREKLIGLVPDFTPGGKCSRSDLV